MNSNNRHKKQDGARLILASGSPRRRELVGYLDAEIEIITSDVEEGDPKDSETPAEYVARLAREKAEAVADGVNDGIVVGADTTVVLDGKVLGKPQDTAEAEAMLRKLRGRNHLVITGVALVDAHSGRRVSTARSSEVHLRQYSDDEMMAYIASGEPMDKAGAYAAQDEEFRPARKIVGCYTNVVGLPLCDLVEMLNGFGLEIAMKSKWRTPEQCKECPIGAKQEAVGA